MGAHSGPDINENGLVLALDGANYRSFKGEATTNYYSTPETLTDGRVGTTSGGTYTDFTTDGPSGGRFTRWTNNTGTSGTTAWHWGIGYTNTGLTTGQTLTVSFYARCPNGTLSNITLNSPDSLAINATLDSTWRRYSGQIIYGGDYTSTPFFRINRSNSNSYTNGATYDIANIQIETKSYATTFTTGTRGTTVATGGGWADLTGNGNNGELVNGVRESANNLGSLSFDGVDDYVIAGTLSGSFASFTLITWFYPTVVVNYNNVLDCNSGYYTSGNIGPRLEMNSSGTLGWVYSNITGDNNQFYAHNVVSSGLSANKWHCAAITYNGGTNTSVTYYNGNATGLSRSTIGSPTGFVGSINSLNIGRGFVNSRYFQGRITQTQIYNRALTASEIQQNFNVTRGRFGI